jgi:3-methyladenine DNA glycosylase/8-oxoguanine DNA glycosylase
LEKKLNNSIIEPLLRRLFERGEIGVKVITGPPRRQRMQIAEEQEVAENEEKGRGEERCERLAGIFPRIREVIDHHLQVSYQKVEFGSGRFSGSARYFRCFIGVSGRSANLHSERSGRMDRNRQNMN